jgi:hypothetical protein
MENENMWDRIIRFILAVVFFVVGSLYVDGAARLALYVLSLVMIITSTTGFCLLYKLFGINTKKARK